MDQQPLLVLRIESTIAPHGGNGHSGGQDLLLELAHRNLISIHGFAAWHSGRTCTRHNRRNQKRRLILWDRQGIKRASRDLGEGTRQIFTACSSI